MGLAGFGDDAFLVFVGVVGVFEPVEADAVGVLFQEGGREGLVEFSGVFVAENPESCAIVSFGGFFGDLHGVELAYEEWSR